jgi:hypothetical protein
VGDATGEVTFGELVDDLAKSYAAPRERTIADVGTLCAAWPTKIRRHAAF